ncbi:MAG: hypothetical protein NTW21_39295 [Verrucomicrobia bacterium]|nr:hypothetical protein [Verrucomicrobiota bacterium]
MNLSARGQEFLAELPKEGIATNISRYAAVIPGGKLSAPSLFFNSSSRQIGLIPRYDVVVVDEIQKIQTDSAGEAMAGLKMYLESGRYRRATGDMGTSEAGFVMLGNITLMVDPYIRLDYQIFNLMSFIELLAPEAGGIELHLVTSAGSNEDEVVLSEKLDTLLQSITDNKVKFTYTFDPAKHDRMIETDTGWRITLGRGLDFLQRAEGRYALGFIDQSQRKCKETSIVMTHGTDMKGIPAG